MDISSMLYVISDLHLGGDYPRPDEPAARGFRMCTHVAALVEFVRSIGAHDAFDQRSAELVINGDFVDFLAEKREVAGPTAGSTELGWAPLIENPDEAARILVAIIERDRVFFDALKDFIARGNRLTILLGNHDIELSYPKLRRVLIHELDARDRKLSFIYDGEAYQVGEVLIEHGNRYDEWNVVSHDALRQFRSAQSRQEPQPISAQPFEAPPGSFLVAGVMNEIKSRYPFIDLLKPETGAALPILLALAPEYRARIATVATLVARSRKHVLGADGLPSSAGDIAAADDSTWETSPGAGLVREILMQKLPVDSFGPFVEELSASTGSGRDPFVQAGGDVRSGSFVPTWSMVKLLFARTSETVSSRLPSLLAALRGTRGDFSFDRGKEVEPYRSAAQRLLSGGFRVVIFGHTHLAKQVALAGGTYINTGTWADVLPFPATVLDAEVGAPASTHPGSETAAQLARLKTFVADMATARLSPYLRFVPTYARVELDTDGVVLHASLPEFGSETRR